MNTEQLRTEFEAWYEKQMGEAPRIAEDMYTPFATACWDAYQAGRAALQSQDAEDTERLDKLMQLADRYAIAVRDNWQPRKHRRALLDHARRIEENK